MPIVTPALKREDALLNLCLALFHMHVHISHPMSGVSYSITTVRHPHTVLAGVGAVVSVFLLPPRHDVHVPDSCISTVSFVDS